MKNGTAKLNREKVRLGITPTLWWNDDFLSIDIGIPFEQCISEMALAGFEGCSVGHKYPTNPALLKNALDLRGLSVSEPWVSTYFTITAMCERTLQAFKQQMEFLKAVGATDMVVAEFGGAVNPLPVALFANRPIFSEAQWSHLCEGLNELGRMAKENGMRLCYHPHMGTGVMIQKDVDRLMENTDPELVYLLLDTGHLAFAGADPLEVTRKYGHRIRHIHLKDVRANVVKRVREENLSFRDGIELGVFTVPGDGAIAFPPIFEALAEADFQGWMVVEAEQDPAKANPLQYAKMARTYLHQQLGW
jgi:inosose dehydratase